MAGGTREIRRALLSECVLRHRRRISVHYHCRDWYGARARAAMVCHLHMVWRLGSIGLLILVEHAVAVRDSRAMPVAVQGLPSRKVTDEENGIAPDMPQIPAGLNKYYRLNIDLMVDVLWIVAIVVLIIVTEGAALFAA